MANKMLFKRGLKNNLPILSAGEPAFTTDSKELYVGTGSQNVLINSGGGALPTVIYTCKGDGTDGLGIGKIIGERTSLSIKIIIIGTMLGNEGDTIYINVYKTHPLASNIRNTVYLDFTNCTVLSNYRGYSAFISANGAFDLIVDGLVIFNAVDEENISNVFSIFYSSSLTLVNCTLDLSEVPEDLDVGYNLHGAIVVHGTDCDHIVLDNCKIITSLNPNYGLFRAQLAVYTVSITNCYLEINNYLGWIKNTRRVFFQNNHMIIGARWVGSFAVSQQAIFTGNFFEESPEVLDADKKFIALSPGGIVPSGSYTESVLNISNNTFNGVNAFCCEIIGYSNSAYTLNFHNNYVIGPFTSGTTLFVMKLAGYNNTSNKAWVSVTGNFFRGTAVSLGFTPNSITQLENTRVYMPQNANFFAGA